MTEERGGGDEADGLEARYANYCEVGHNAFEFVVVFGQVGPESGAPRPHTKVVTTPTYAQAFSRTLLEALSHYERTFGLIPTADDGTVSS